MNCNYFVGAKIRKNGISTGFSIFLGWLFYLGVMKTAIQFIKKKLYIRQPFEKRAMF